MLTELGAQDHQRAARLFTGLDHQLSLAAVLASAMPGQVFVDDAVRPSAAFVRSPEGNFVGGRPESSFVVDLRALLSATYSPELEGDLVISFDDHSWTRVAPDLAPELHLISVPRRHYLVGRNDTRGRQDPPSGYEVVPIDATLLRHPRLPHHLRAWVDGNWGDEESFLGKGFGVVALKGASFAGWSVADCVVGDRSEIGIHTAPEHRRRGVATAVAAAAVQLAFDRGLIEVGWHCNEDNPGSSRTAESVGFSLARRYEYVAYSPRT